MKVAELLLKYKSDKNHGTIKNIYNNLDNWEICENPEPYIGHTYGDSYDEIFEQFDRNSNIDFLEIGIQKGGSLLAWKDYFINSNIYGVDIVDSILPEYRREEFVYIISDIKDISVKERLKDILFDIIIDDGSHYLSDVLFVVSNYLEKLKKGGVLIVEDCQEPENWLKEVTKLVPDGFSISTKDLRGGYDNFLIVIKKNE
jgi:SAM-dependent methyltransferase